MKEREIVKELLKTLMRSYGLSCSSVHRLVDASAQEMALSCKPGDMSDEVVKCPTGNGGKVLLCVDKNLKVVTDFRKAVAAVALFKEKKADVYDPEDLKDLNTSKPLVNIAFFEPIAQNVTLDNHDQIKAKWRKKHYPNYNVTLISHNFSYIAKECSLNVFKCCWTRSASDDGYPQYRSYRISETCDYGENDNVPNVYVSLVMTEEDFLKINPDVEWRKYVWCCAY